jgi:hypothetical protein
MHPWYRLRAGGITRAIRLGATRLALHPAASGRLTGRGVFNSAGTVLAAVMNNYRYNGLGHRIMEQWDEDASDVLDADERLYYVHDSRWRQVAAYRDQDANPKEVFIYHAAGLAGMGGSSYIDSVILRDRDNTACGTGCDPWLQSSDGVLEQRRYYVQNWRADVTALLKSTGEPVEWIRYTAYGTPTVHPIADINGDGSVTSADYTAWTDLYNNGISTTAVFLNPDLNRDDVYPNQDDDDYFVEQYNLTVAKAAGFDQLSTLGNRKGYAGYERDESLTMYHVRHRVLDSKGGKWTRTHSSESTSRNAVSIALRTSNAVSIHASTQIASQESTQSTEDCTAWVPTTNYPYYAPGPLRCYTEPDPTSWLGADRAFCARDWYLEQCFHRACVKAGVLVSETQCSRNSAVGTTTV